MDLRKKIVVTFSVISFVSLVAGGYASYWINSHAVNDLVIENLKTKIEGVSLSAKTAKVEAGEVLKGLISYWSTYAQTHVAQVTQIKNINFEDQNTHQKYALDFNSLAIDGQDVLLQNAWIDEMSSKTGAAATLMTLHPKGLLRLSTSLKRKDGTRAVGTFIPNSSPVYESIKKGESYIGRAKVLDTWYSTIYEPIFQNNKVIGCLFLGRPETASMDLIKSLRAEKIYDTGFFYILNSQGELILHPTLEGQNVADVKDLDGNYLFKDILKVDSGQIKYNWKDEKTNESIQKLAIFKSFPEFDWHLVASVNEYETRAAVRSLAKVIILVSASSVALMILVSFLFGRSIANYLEQIASSTTKSTDEVDESIVRLATSTKTLSNSSTSSAASIEETAASLEELGSITKANEQSAKISAELSENSLRMTLEGEKKIKHLIEAMKTTEAHSKRINEITEVIDDIAFQTNLLALNAAVEAARAGDQGKGFAVVADAVRSLAQRSGAAAQDIAKLIAESSAIISEGSKVADSSEAILREILDGAKKMSALSNELSNSTREQSQGIQQISQAINQIDQDSQANAKIAEDVTLETAQIEEQIAIAKNDAGNLYKFVTGVHKKSA